MSWCPLGNVCPSDPCPYSEDCKDAVIKDLVDDTDPTLTVDTPDKDDD